MAKEHKQLIIFTFLAPSLIPLFRFITKLIHTGIIDIKTFFKIYPDLLLPYLFIMLPVVLSRSLIPCRINPYTMTLLGTTAGIIFLSLRSDLVYRQSSLDFLFVLIMFLAQSLVAWLLITRLNVKRYLPAARKKLQCVYCLYQRYTISIVVLPILYLLLRYHHVFFANSLFFTLNVKSIISGLIFFPVLIALYLHYRGKDNFYLRGLFSILLVPGLVSAFIYLLLPKLNIIDLLLKLPLLGPVSFAIGFIYDTIYFWKKSITTNKLLIVRVFSYYVFITILLTIAALLLNGIIYIVTKSVFLPRGFAWDEVKVKMYFIYLFFAIIQLVISFEILQRYEYKKWVFLLVLFFSWLAFPTFTHWWGSGENGSHKNELYLPIVLVVHKLVQLHPDSIYIIKSTMIWFTVTILFWLIYRYLWKHLVQRITSPLKSL